MQKLTQFGLCDILLYCTIMFISGCSTKVYTKEVTAFNNGVQDSIEAYKKYEKLANDEYIQYLLRDVPLRNHAANLGAILLPPTCITELHKIKDKYDEYLENQADLTKLKLEPTPCQLLATDASGTFRPIKTNFSLRAETSLIKAISKYSKLLAEIAESKDVDELYKKASNMETTLNSLYSTISTISHDKGSVKPIGPLNSILINAGVKALDIKRFNVLKGAINQADSNISKATTILTKASTGYYIDTLLYQAQIMRQDTSDIRNPSTKDKDIKSYNASLIKKHYDFSALETEGLPDIFNDMKKAHAELVNAVNDPSKQFESATTFITSFAAKAEDLKKSLTQIEDKEPNN